MRTLLRPWIVHAWLGLLLPLAGPAFGDAGIAGRWHGEIEVPGSPLAVEVTLAQDDRAWSGTISIPVQNATDLPLEAVTVTGQTVTFRIAGVPGTPTFEGSLDPAADAITGRFSQGGATFPFALARGEAAMAGVDALAAIDDLVKAALDDWNTPGLAVAVVVQGQVVLSRGFGLRNVEERLPVTPATLFAIGSATKAFTALTVATLVDDGRLAWDAPVAEYLAGFRLQDDYASLHLSVRDLLTHRSGLPRHDLVWYNDTRTSRAELVSRLRHLPPNRQLRERWQYNNLMYLTAGYLVEQLTGRTWEDAVRTRVFEPLGMERSNFSVAASAADPDHAVPYVEEDDRLRPVAFRPMDVMGPAGSINSTADDMARWVQLHLGSLEDNAGVLTGATRRELHTPQAVIPAYPTEVHVSPTSYALGWFTDTWRGHYRVYHGGNIDGFSALVTLFPHDNAGVVVLVNRNASPLPGLITAVIADRLLLPGDRWRDWLGEAAGQRDEARPFVEQGERDRKRYRRTGTRPTFELAEYAGRYHHPGYGQLGIELDGRRLLLVHNGMCMPLEHWHYDVFSVAEVDDELIPENLRVSFRTGQRGFVEALDAAMEPMVAPIAFQRLPDARLSDPGFLARLAGSYELPGQAVRFILQGESLIAVLPGQPAYPLEPLVGGVEFGLEGLSGFSVRFEVPEQGPAGSAVFVQPNGVFPATRSDGRAGAEGRP